MRKVKQAAVVSGVLGLLAGVAAWFGPFIAPEAVEGLLERVRRSLPGRRRPRSPYTSSTTGPIPPDGG